MLHKSEFTPAWWMSNRHLQTILPRLYPVPCDFAPVHQDFELADGDFTQLTWTDADQPINDQQPLVIVLHGLEGSFESFYAKRMMNSLYRQGWHAVLLHFRGCGHKPNRRPSSYHSGHTVDLKQFVQFLKRKYPNNPLYAVGFSLGGNVLAKYLGEEEDSALNGGVVISAPLELAECAKTMEQGFARVYQKYLVDRLKNSTAEKIDYLKGKYNMPIDKPRLNEIVKLAEFDELLTAPLNGFIDAHDYYKKSSARPYLKSITTPTLVLHAKDDPFMNESVLPSPEMLSEMVRFELSEHGGHVGFITGKNPFKPEFWLETRTIQFFKEREENA